MIEIAEVIARVLPGQSCHRVVLSGPRDRGSQQPVRIVVRPVTVSGELHYQFTSDLGRLQTHENLLPAAAVARVGQLFPEAYEHCNVFTTEADFSARGGPETAVRVQQRNASNSDPPATAHDRTRKYLLPEGTPCAFLERIGVMNSEGKVKRARRDKFRQVNRFLELVDDVVEALPSDRVLEIVDFGCGKSYLTFALHHLLTELRGREVRILGLDRDAETVSKCNRVAEDLGLREVEFHIGDIAGCSHPGPVDLAVALHACDTATDDALARAIAWQTGLILAVPCCQHELASGLGEQVFASAQRHGILRERLAALLTDALRAEALEICGYKTQVVEFIDIEHTAKNLLLRAVKRERFEAPHRAARVESYRQGRSLLNLETTRLEEQLGQEFCETVGVAWPPG